jgi:SAM-dependent methyltransferase
MQKEIDLLKNYPKTKRDLKKRLEERTEEDRQIARRFGEDFFDGDRRHGYGGFSYQSRFWENVIPDFVTEYQLNSKSHVLDVGCAKGFMLFDFMRILPGVTVKGVDISEYAIKHAVDEVAPYLEVGNAEALPYADASYDLVISINTIHNLDLKECKTALKEIQRISKGDAFLTVDAFSNEEEKKRMDMWNLTAKTILHVDDWRALFHEAGYTGDYYWFIP